MERDSLNLLGSSKSLPAVFARDFSIPLNSVTQNGKKSSIKQHRAQSVSSKSKSTVSKYGLDSKLAEARLWRIRR